MSAEWESAVVPAGFRGSDATFLWMAGLASGYGAHRFQLFVDGQPVCIFRSAKDTSEREWTVTGEGGAALSFRTTLVGHFNEMFGFMSLRLPRGYLTPGAPLRFKVVGEAAGSQDYFMVFEKPLESGVAVHPEEAVVRRGGRLARPIRVEVSHIGRPAEVIVTASGTRPRKGALVLGYNAFHVDVPAQPEGRTVDVSVIVDGTVAARESVTLRSVPRRKVYLLPHSHLDIGYSDHQTEVERKQVENLRGALGLIARTAGYPEEARFRWNNEGLWAVERFLAVATPEERRQLAEAVRGGSLSLTAFFANELTGLCPPEELERLTRYARRLERELGAPVRSALINDIPGASWPVVTALAEAGVRYFASGPNYMPGLPSGGDRIGGFLREWGDRPFWWVSPSGREKILFWVAGRGYSWFHARRLGRDFDECRRGILDYLEELSQAGYPYDVVQVNYTVGGDNGPPDAELPDAVRRWNAEFETPRLVIGTVDEMFAELERRHGQALPAFAGDLSPYWEDGALSTARETALNRSSVQRLLQAAALWSITAPERFPAEEFDAAWRAALLWDEHTWGAAASVSEPDRPEVIAQWAYKRAFAEEADRRSRAVLAAALGESAEGPVHAMEVINTLSWPRGGLVTIPAEWKRAGDRVRDEASRALPSQRLSTGALAVLVPEVPGLGSLRFLLDAGPASGAGQARASGTLLENARLTARVDPLSGAIAELRWAHGRPIDFAAGGAGLNAYVYVAGRDPKAAVSNGPVTVAVVEPGPLVAALRIESPAPGANRLVRELWLAEASEGLGILDVVDKVRVRDKESVHFAFPFQVPGGQVRVDLGGGLVVPGVSQLPGACRDFLAAHSGVDVSNQDWGISLVSLDAPLVEIGALTDETFGGQPARSWRTVWEGGTTVYSYAMNNYWHTNYKADQDGVVSFRYRLRPHGPFDAAGLRRLGAEESQPLVVAPAGGTAPSRRPPFRLEPEAVMVSALEPAAAGSGLLVRLFNASAAPQVARVLCGEEPCAGLLLADPHGEPTRAVEGPLELAPFGSVWIRIRR
jgi:hypothetical protein